MANTLRELVASCNGEPMILQVHYYHNDIAENARYGYSLEAVSRVL
jgi:hypothetical protein